MVTVLDLKEFKKHKNFEQLNILKEGSVNINDLRL